MFNMVVGKAAAQNVVVLTTKWDIVEPEVGERREAQLKEDPKFFESILGAGATMFRYGRGISPRNVIRFMLKRHDTPVTLRIQEDMMDGKGVGETAAGQVVNREINNALQEAQEKQRKEIEEIREKMKNELNQEIDRTKRSMQAAHDQAVANINARMGR
jgi:regulator of PEP synthase PpsR (kinase-PPPase family)